MKKLEKKITELLSLKPLSPEKKELIELHGLSAVFEAGGLDVVSDIMKAIGEYFHEVEEAACYLLEIWPLENNTIAIKSKVTDTCTLVYSISKE